MHRRELLMSAGALGMAAWSGPAGAATPGLRRLRPSDAAWPSQSEWDALAARVGGKLMQPKPLFAACADPKQADACRSTLKESANPLFIGDQVSGTQVSGWYKAWKPEPSAYAIVAHNAEDIAQGVNFARAHNLRLVVKGPGHSYLGCSSAPDSLLIWTRAMNDVVVHDAFTPLGCEDKCAAVPAVSVGGGAIWIDVYHAVTVKGGRYAQGGGCTDVGVAGLVQGGGFGSLSKGFGTAGASLIEAEVVTADGRTRVVNAHRDPDLFWALKGGGGGNFAVVTRLTLKTHDLPTNFGYVSGALKARSDDDYRRLLDRFLAVYADSILGPHWGEQAHLEAGNVLRITMLAQGLTDAEMHAAWQPLLDWAADPKNGIDTTDHFQMAVIPPRLFWDFETHRSLGLKDVVFDDRAGAPPWHGWWSGDAGQVGTFLCGYDSTWLPRRLLAPEHRPALVEALFEASRAHDVDLHFNKGLAGALPDSIEASRDTPMNPAVLDAFTLVIVAEGSLPAYPGSPYPPVNTAAVQKRADAVDLAMLPLRKLAPGAGSYVAESNFFNPHWQEEYWGQHYGRLRRIKARYDPGGLFITHHGVGSEDWSADGFERRA
jgi:FAD/FMN-containing dehydrogenase